MLKAGVKDPIAIQKAVAVYTEIGGRHVSVPVDDAYKGDARAGRSPSNMSRPSTTAAHVIAETQAVLR